MKSQIKARSKKAKSAQNHIIHKKKTNSRKCKTHNCHLSRHKPKTDIRKYRRKHIGGFMAGTTGFSSSYTFVPPPKPPFGCTIC